MSEIVIQGRPDFENHKFGVTRAKRHPKYVYGNSMGLLVHEILYVEFHWYTVGDGGHSLVRLANPRITINTRCGQAFFYRTQNGQPRSTMCEIPNADAILCGRCQGKGAVFAKGGKWAISKRDAKARLGCSDIVRLD